LARREKFRAGKKRSTWNIARRETFAQAKNVPRGTLRAAKKLFSEKSLSL